MSVTREIERKYDVNADAVVPSLVGAGALVRSVKAEVYELDAVYYDTAGFDLASRQIALRRREGGHDAGWHIKRTSDAEGRVEEQFPLSPVVRASGDESGSMGRLAGGAAGGSVTGYSVELPAEVRAALASVVGDQPVIAVARVRNRRAATVWSDAAGRPLVEFADDHVRAIDEREGVARHWREWEVELIPSALTESTDRSERDALLDAVEEKLVAVGAVRARGTSKLQRALGKD